MKNLFLLYYKNDSQLLFIAKDEEMSALQYIALRYMEHNEVPVFLSDATGKCCDQEWNDEALQDLKLWYYSLHPECRREDKRRAAWELVQQQLARPLESEGVALIS